MMIEVRLLGNVVVVQCDAVGGGGDEEERVAEARCPRGVGGGGDAI